jgi:formylglycine-generating enzyme required for sulfatase activity
MTSRKGTWTHLVAALSCIAIALVAVVGCRAGVMRWDDERGAEQAFGGGAQCSELRPQPEPDLMAWAPSSRAKLATRANSGAVAVRYAAQGCDVELDVLDCSGEGSYAFEPYSATESKVAHNAGELYAELPLGASRLGSRVWGSRALRTDYMLAGVTRLGLLETYEADRLQGRDCEEATHVIEAIYVGGFALAWGQTTDIDAGGRVFGVGAGVRGQSARDVLATEGDAEACARSQRTQEHDGRCAVPLRVGLIPIAGRVSDGCPRGSSWDGTRCVAREVIRERVCPEGSQRQGSRCVMHVDTECPAGTRFETGEGCVALSDKRCPEGMRFSPGTGCVANVDKTCPSGLWFVSGRGCVAGPRSRASTSGMVRIPGGKFRSGEDAHIVADFWIDETPVTTATYRACVEGGACVARTTTFWAGKQQGRALCNYGRRGRDTHPMNCITWQDAADYCGWARKRLPTEWEWEWAARGGDEARTYPWGKTPPSTATACLARPSEGTCEVTAHPDGASRDGVLDLVGNVWEWTDSPPSSETHRIVRGGGWDVELDDPSLLTASSARGSGTPSFRLGHIGFRCVTSG